MDYFCFLMEKLLQTFRISRPTFCTILKESHRTTLLLQRRSVSRSSELSGSAIESGWFATHVQSLWAGLVGPSRRTTKVGAGRCKIVAFLCSQATSGLLLSYIPTVALAYLTTHCYGNANAMPLYNRPRSLRLGERSQIPTKAATSKQHV